MSNESANESYKVAQQESAELIAQLQDVLKAHAERQKKTARHWTHVGDLNHINTQLAALIDFIDV